MPEIKQKKYHGNYTISMSGVPEELLFWLRNEAEKEGLTLSQSTKRMLLAIMREKTNQKTASD
jgi:hypothetical protein